MAAGEEEALPAVPSAAPWFGIKRPSQGSQAARQTIEHSKVLPVDADLDMLMAGC